jgi:hypothetical protein
LFYVHKFVLGGREIANGRVNSLAVIEELDVFKYLLFCLFSRGETRKIYEFSFENAMKGLDARVSSPRESHPQALSEPDLNLSAHPAPIIQPT